MLGINSFPWNIELNDFTCTTTINNVQRVFLPSVNTKLTLDLTKKDKENGSGGGGVGVDEMSFVIHMDTTPIRLDLETAQIEQIYRSLNAILLKKPKQKQINPSVIEVSASFYDTQINDFFYETTNSEKSSEDIIANVDRNVSKIHYLLQWTITKFTLSLNDSYHSHNHSEIELLIDLEDIIVSIDKQSAYSKAKAKFGSINGIRKKKNSTTGELDILNMITRSDALTADSQETFLEVVATTAIASNVHSRWGTALVKGMGFRNDVETITELVITMQSIDLKLEADVVTVILNASNKITDANNINNSHNGDVYDNETIYCVRDLPLLFFNCKGLQLWLPNTNYDNASESNVLIVKVNHFNFSLVDFEKKKTIIEIHIHTYSIFQMNAISIAPSVENPLIRKLIREDIYVKAAQLRMINTPGSIIEDRQYELLLKNISIFTGNWNEILKFSGPVNVIVFFFF